jgi:hypothetical protein
MQIRNRKRPKEEDKPMTRDQRIWVVVWLVGLLFTLLFWNWAVSLFDLGWEGRQWAPLVLAAFPTLIAFVVRGRWPRTA